MNVKIHFLLNPQVITMMSNTYSWALKSKEEFDELPDKEKSEIRDVRGKFNYIDQAVELINLELEDQYRYVGLKRIDETDLKRAYRIQLGQEPDDRLGTIYNWVMAKFPLLLPYKGNKCVKHLCDCNTKHEVQLKLYDDFIEDMEDRGKLTSITRIPGGYLDAHTIEQLFLDVLEVIEDYNPEMAKIYDFNMVKE